MSGNRTTGEQAQTSIAEDDYSIRSGTTSVSNVVRWGARVDTIQPAPTGLIRSRYWAEV